MALYSGDGRTDGQMGGWGARYVLPLLVDGQMGGWGARYVLPLVTVYCIAPSLTLLHSGPRVLYININCGFYYITIHQHSIITADPYTQSSQF